VTGHRQFRPKKGKNPSSDLSIQSCYKRFTRQDSACKGNNIGTVTDFSLFWSVRGNVKVPHLSSIQEEMKKRNRDDSAKTEHDMLRKESRRLISVSHYWSHSW